MGFYIVVRSIVHLVAYSTRMHLGKALQTRCKAIRRAINDYNTAADALIPPRLKLNWTDVSKYSFIEQLNFLKNSQGDITQKKWAEPEGRMMLKQWRKIQRAQEEIVRCNVEARRLHTFIRDEEHLFSCVLSDMKDRADPWYGALVEFSQRRTSVNAHIMESLQRMYRLERFSGRACPGHCTDGITSHLAFATPSSAHPDIHVDVQEDEDEDEDDEDGGDDEELQLASSAAMDFLSSLAT